MRKWLEPPRPLLVMLEKLAAHLVLRVFLFGMTDPHAGKVSLSVKEVNSISGGGLP